MTLIELIVAIVVGGILVTLTGMFIRLQIESYFDVARRAELADTADTAFRTIARELQGALPNSVRVDGNFLEFVPIRDAGRYRVAQGGSPLAGDILDFADPLDASFDVLGPPVSIAAGQSLVIYNLGLAGADAYEGSSRRAATAGSNLANVGYTVGAMQFPFPSPQKRFHVVDAPVTFECRPDAANPANGVLVRRANYGWQNPQPKTSCALAVAPALPNADCAVVAGNLSACEFRYIDAVLQRNGLVSVRLGLTQADESVTLQQQVEVLNAP